MRVSPETRTFARRLRVGPTGVNQLSRFKALAMNAVWQLSRVGIRKFVS